MYIFVILISIFYIVGIIYYYKNKKKFLNQYIQKKRNQIEAEIAERTYYKNSLDSIIQEKHGTLDAIQKQIDVLHLEKQVLTKELEEYEKQQKEYLDHHIQIIKEIKTNETLNQLEKERKQAEAEFECLKKEKQNEIDALFAQLQSYQAKQEAINQEILRRRELEEKADFYRVCLSDEAKIGRAHV